MNAGVLKFAGKEPDWSTGPIATSGAGSTGGSQGFPRNSSLDAMLPNLNFPRRTVHGGQGPPGLGM